MEKEKIEVYVNDEFAFEFLKQVICKNHNKSFRTNVNRNRDLIIGMLPMKLETCRFCGRPAYFDFDYSYDHSLKRLTVNGYVYPQYYYCYPTRSKVFCVGSRENPNSIKFISTVRDISNAEALKFIHDRNASPFYAVNHKSAEDYKKSQTRSIEFFESIHGNSGYSRMKDRDNKISQANKKETYIRKYGIKRAEEISKSKDNSSLDYFIGKYGEELGEIEFQNKLQRTKINLDYFIAKHGEKTGRELYDKHCANVGYRNSVDYYISRYGEELGIEKYSDHCKMLNLKYNWTKKYGQEVAEGMWNDYIEKQRAIRIERPFSVSKECEKFFDEIESIIDFYQHKTYREYWQRDGKEIYFYDFCVGKNIIEYDGVYWHPLSESDIRFFDVKSNIERNKKKRDLVKSRDFNFMSVRSDDPERIEKCIIFLESHGFRRKSN